MVQIGNGSDFVKNLNLSKSSTAGKENVKYQNKARNVLGEPQRTNHKD